MFLKNYVGAYRIRPVRRKGRMRYAPTTQQSNLNQTHKNPHANTPRTFNVL